MSTRDRTDGTVPPKPDGGLFGRVARTVAGLWADRSGGYGIAFTLALVPIFGGLALAIDFTEMNRQRQATLNALDAAGIATARQIVTGVDDATLRAYAKDFFEANLSDVDPADTTLYVDLPSNEPGKTTLKLSADLRYRPNFFPVFEKALNGFASGTEVGFSARTEIQLKNTLEVALVLDNSGSMKDEGSGSGEARIDLLKAAAKELVNELAKHAALIRQVDKPVQFALVPFAASVNVGPANAGAAWMDTNGLSPIHHESFDWSTLDAENKTAENIAGIWYKKGEGWGDEENGVLSRFSLYRDMRKVDSREWVVTSREYICTDYRRNGTCKEGRWHETGYWDETIATYASWQGCVEARPYPYNVNDATPAGVDGLGLLTGDPATLFVPMFAPDEPGDRWATEADAYPDGFSASNNWWNDGTESGDGQTRLRNMAKYFEVRPYGASTKQGTGPNYSCTTNPITPLTDVTTEAGLATITGAIDAMAPNGGTNVPEGMAWGWRAVSGGEPFAEGRPDSEKGNDKVVIVLTDGENTYYTPDSLGYGDPAASKAVYSSYGYLWPNHDGGSEPRLFMGTSTAVGRGNYSNDNYTVALNEQMSMLCDNAKEADVLVMTVSLDLSTTDTGEQEAIEALKECASESRFRKDENGKPVKLFWNATGSDLADKFREIAQELSNLRIVS